MLFLAAFIMMVATPVPTEPPTPPPRATAYAGEDCIASTGATFSGTPTSHIHSGYIWYCRWGDPNPNRHLDPNDYLWSTPAGCSACAEVRYYASGDPYISGGNEPIGGLPGPAWLWLLIIVIVFVWLAKTFGPKAGGWSKPNKAGIQTKDPKNKDRDG